MTKGLQNYFFFKLTALKNVKVSYWERIQGLRQGNHPQVLAKHDNSLAEFASQKSFRFNRTHYLYRVIFLTGPPLKMFLDWPLPKMPRLAPPYLERVLSIAAERGEIRNTLTFSIPRRGQSVANSGEVQLKNHSVSSCDGKVYIGFENIKHVCCVKS